MEFRGAIPQAALPKRALLVVITATTMQGHSGPTSGSMSAEHWRKPRAMNCHTLPSSDPNQPAVDSRGPAAWRQLYHKPMTFRQALPQANDLPPGATHTHPHNDVED